MKTAALAVLFAIIAAGCGARTAYSADRREWTCVPTTRHIEFPAEPLAVTEAPKPDKAVAAK